jgi:SAM-dependent methyltransferase
VSIDDPELVRAEYADEERLLARRVVFSDYLVGPSAEDVALEVLRDAKPRLVLEIGCGPGYFGEQVRAELGASVIGIDTSARMVELARGRGLDARVGDAQALPFGDGEFDSVVANWMLYHIPDVDRALAELVRVLRPGGRLVAATFAPDHVREVWGLVGGDVRDAQARFDRDSGLKALRRHFPAVERHDVDGTVVFPSREAVRVYIAATIRGAELADRLPEFEGPFRARSAQSVFVAETAG